MHAIARVPCFQSVEACIQGPELAAARAPSPTCPSHRAPNLALPPPALPCLGLPPTLNPVHHREHHLTSTHRQPWVSHSARCVLAVSLPWLWPCWARADRRSSFHGRLSPCARAPSRRRRNSCVSATSSVWRQQAEHNADAHPLHPLLQSPASVRTCARPTRRPCYRGWPGSKLTRPSLSGMPSTPHRFSRHATHNRHWSHRSCACCCRSTVGKKEMR